MRVEYHPLYREQLQMAYALQADLRGLLEDAKGDPDVTAHYQAELEKIEHWIASWPDSAMPRVLVEG